MWAFVSPYLHWWWTWKTLFLLFFPCLPHLVTVCVDVVFEFMAAVIVHSSSLFCQPACPSGSKVASPLFLQKNCCTSSFYWYEYFLCVCSRGLVVFNGTGTQREFFFNSISMIARVFFSFPFFLFGLIQINIGSAYIQLHTVLKFGHSPWSPWPL